MLDHPDEAAQLAVKHAIDGKDPSVTWRSFKLRNAVTVDEHTRQHGPGWFDIAPAGKSRAHLSGIGTDQEYLEVQRLFTNGVVQAL